MEKKAATSFDEFGYVTDISAISACGMAKCGVVTGNGLNASSGIYSFIFRTITMRAAEMFANLRA